MLYFISEQKYVCINQFWCLLLYCRICSVCFSGLQRMRTRINLQSTWKSQIILVMNYMNDTCTNSSLVAKVFSLLSTGVYQHSKLIVPKKKRKNYASKMKKKMSSIWNLQNVIKWHRKDTWPVYWSREISCISSFHLQHFLNTKPALHQPAQMSQWTRA